MQLQTKKYEDNTTLRLAKEFLEQRLGVSANDRNICRFATLIDRFERDLEKAHKLS